MLLASAQDGRRVAFGVGVESAGKIQLLRKTGSPYGLFGSYAVQAAVRFLPTDERGFTSTLRVSYVRDNTYFGYAANRSFGVHRSCTRVEAEAMVPTRSELFWLSAAIGVDWNVEQTTSLGSRGTGGANDSLALPYANADLERADLDLWTARRLLVPIITIGPVLRIPSTRKPLWVQLFVRQAFLDAWEAPVAVSIREDFFNRYGILVSQRPTSVGLSVSYFF
jgi:hypothetical protein